MTESKIPLNSDFYDDDNIRKDITRRLENHKKIQEVKEQPSSLIEMETIIKLKEFDDFKRCEGSFIKEKKHRLENCGFELSHKVNARLSEISKFILGSGKDVVNNEVYIDEYLSVIRTQIKELNKWNKYEQSIYDAKVDDFHKLASEYTKKVDTKKNELFKGYDKNYLKILTINIK